jgi:hypothetical protein
MGEALIESGMLELVPFVLQNPSSTPLAENMRISALKALATLARSVALQPKILAAGVLRPVIDTVVSGNVKLQVHATGVLANLFHSTPLFAVCRCWSC